ncbi:MAG TPA: zf-HC2 domain-containing protein [Vicinamibacterales bacterium]|nr:zf-HC2 domain-containing protein [Vicinamibacterales bacterium]
MCDTELLIGYVYGEMAPSEREAFDRHLTSCAACRSEVDGLRGTRTYLESWTPPEPDLGFEVVRSSVRGAAKPARWWGLSPAWGLAAAALLVGAVSAAIANVEVTTSAGAIVIRTGWSRTVNAQAAPATPTVAAGELQRVEARVRELESQIAAVRAQPAVAPAGVTSRMADADMVRLVRQLIAQSEERQHGELARQILQVNRDFEVARRTDLDRLGRGLEQIQRTTVDTYQRQKALEDHFIRVGLQR